jgi:hypothetical protein
VAPTRELAGAATTFSSMDNAVVRYDTDELYASGYGQPSILVFDRTTTGDVAPKRSIVGAATQLKYPVDKFFDYAHDELIVIDAQGGILVFPIGATGDVAPTRQIAGNTSLAYDCEGGAFNPTTGEIFAACGNTVVVFDRTATGDVAPKRSFTVTAMTAIHDVGLMR